MDHPEWLKIEDAPAAPHAEVPDYVKIEDEAKPSPEPVGGIKTALSHFLEGATLGGVKAMNQAQALAPSGPSAEERQAKFDTAYTQGAKENPYTAASADVGGFLAGPGAFLPGKLATAGTVGRGAIGAGVGALASGATALNQGGGAEEAFDAAKEGAKFGGAAAAFPLATAGYLGAKALKEDDPVRRAQLVTNAGALAVPGALSKLGPVGEAAMKPAEAAKGEVLRGLLKDILPEEVKATKARNAEGAKAARGYFNRLKGATEPVGGGPGVPGSPNTPDLTATAQGKLGNEVQENFRYLRSKDPLGLQLQPEAEAGVKAILPDYEAQANTNLSKFAGGKDARLKEIIAALEAERSAPPPASSSSGELSSPGQFMNPELLPTTSTLKPNPLAGFTPEPLPTEASLAPKLAEQVAPEIARMRQESGVGARLAKGAVKGVMNPLGAVLSGGGLMTNHPAGPVAAGLIGMGRAVATDPVLATMLLPKVAGLLRGSASLAKRVGPFLAGATGPTLVKKIEFLNKNDPEFAAALAAQPPGTP